MLQELSTHDFEFNFPLEFLKPSLTHRIGFGNKSGSEFLQRFPIENSAGILLLPILIKYPHLNVKIGATHGGISVGEDGASHQCCEDFALMRSLPGMTVICPADDVEARAAVRAAYAMQGPVYLRFGRLAVPVFHDEANYHFELGKGEQLTEGNDIAIIATGLMVNEARLAAEQLAAEGIHARVINIHTIKPLDEEIVIQAAKECGKVITAEEHSVIGGLGEAVCAVLSEKCPTPVRRVGVQDKFGCSGPAWDLLKLYGLDAATICKTAHEML